MKRNLFYIALALIGLFTLSGCMEEEYGYPPVYGKVYCVNENPVAGDSLIFRVEVKEPGNGAYKAEYKWTVNGKQYKVEKVLDPLKKAPELGIPNAKAGKYEVSMSAKFNMSIAMQTGQIASTAQSKSGSVIVAAQ
ncbi:MAG: hypothetical protein J6Q19_08690 [Bacteroidaceae bacterium]|nr:hypothetical protein [Bacteroidaceae bacterium]